MRTRVLIHLDRFIDNFNIIRERVGDRLICVPLKADAYGHGAIRIAKTSLDAGAFCLGVAAAEEGVELRENGIDAPILLMSQPHPDEIPVILNYNLIPFISDIDFINNLNDSAKKQTGIFSVHLKIDTGMGRLGCSASGSSGGSFNEILTLVRHITSCKNLKLAGTATHFAVSDSSDPADMMYTRKQIQLFNEVINTIRAAGFDPGIVHAANSGAILLHPDSWFDMVRPGIFLYGYKTAEENEKLGFKPANPQAVMEFKSLVVLIKKINKGESVSYGRTWTADRDTNIAVLPAGYADGLPRLASGKWQVVINGNVYPLAGMICMDHCCVDLGPETKVRRWDEAVIFGGCAPDAAVLAKKTGTIPYEITCNISKRVPRVFTESKKN